MTRHFCKRATLSIITASLFIPSALLFYPLTTNAQTRSCASVVAGAVAGAIGASAASKIVAVSTSDAGTQAGTIVGAGAQYGQFFSKCVITPIAIRLGKAMLQNITSGIITWINSGFHGNPSFVTNLHSLIQDSTDQAIGQFIQKDLGAGFLCNSFSLQVKITLAQTYLPYRERSVCTLNQISNNVSGFVQDNNNGGWDNWLQVTTVPQNNVFGATVLAQNELSKVITDKLQVQNRELDWGKGFRSWSVCTSATDENGKKIDPSKLSPTDSKCDQTETHTPGSVVESQLETALGSGVRQLEVANDLDAIVGALTNQLMSQVITGAKGLLGVGKKSNGSSGSVSYAQAISGNITDPGLQTAIDSGINTISTDANLSAVFSTDQGSAPVTTSTDTTNNTPQVPTEVTQDLRFSTSKTTPAISNSVPFVYNTNLVSSTPRSGLTIRTTLRNSDGQPIPFLSQFVAFQISYGQTNGTIATKYINSNTDASVALSNVSVDPNSSFVLRFGGYNAGVSRLSYNSLELETIVTDKNGNVVLTNVFNFTAQ